MKAYVVVGLGKFGSAVALELMRLGNEVLVIDRDEELVQRIAAFVTDAVVADAQDEGVLRSLGIRNYDCGVVAIGEDISASILITMLLKEFGLKQVLCKASDEMHRKALLKVGADKAVIPEKEMAHRFARSLASASVMDYIELSPDVAMVEFNAPDQWGGKTLRELNVRAKYGFAVMAFRRGERFVVSPDPGMPIEASDVIVALGSVEDLAQITGK